MPSRKKPVLPGFAPRIAYSANGQTICDTPGSDSMTRNGSPPVPAVVRASSRVDAHGGRRPASPRRPSRGPTARRQPDRRRVQPAGGTSTVTSAALIAATRSTCRRWRPGAAMTENRPSASVSATGTPSTNTDAPFSRRCPPRASTVPRSSGRRCRRSPAVVGALRRVGRQRRRRHRRRRRRRAAGAAPRRRRAPSRRGRRVRAGSTAGSAPRRVGAARLRVARAPAASTHEREDEQRARSRRQRRQPKPVARRGRAAADGVRDVRALRLRLPPETVTPVTARASDWRAPVAMSTSTSSPLPSCDVVVVEEQHARLLPEQADVAAVATTAMSRPGGDDRQVDPAERGVDSPSCEM